MLAIEIVEGCNFKCYFCKAREVEKNVYLDFELFKKIITEAKELGIDRIKLTPCRGEPFLHPHIYEMLEFANNNMKHIDMFTNATAINIDKLKKINLDHLSLCISKYGSNAEEFSKLTVTNSRMYNIFCRKLKELTEAGIRYEIHYRGTDYEFDFEEGPVLYNEEFNFKSKCQYHQQPKVLANGDISFCMFSREEMPNSKSIRYANLNNISLKEAVEHPLRYKFMDSQSICSKHCGSALRNCHNEVSIVSLKMLNASKKNYQANQEAVDKLYREMEDEVAQSSVQPTKP